MLDSVHNHMSDSVKGEEEPCGFVAGKEVGSVQNSVGYNQEGTVTAEVEEWSPGDLDLD